MEISQRETVTIFRVFDVIYTVFFNRLASHQKASKILHKNMHFVLRYQQHNTAHSHATLAAGVISIIVNGVVRRRRGYFNALKPTLRSVGPSTMPRII